MIRYEMSSLRIKIIKISFFKVGRLMHICGVFQIENVRNVRRLVRGLGASTSDSRSGYYAALVAFLSTAQDEYPTLKNLFELMDATLSVGTVKNPEKVSINPH